MNRKNKHLTLRLTEHEKAMADFLRENDVNLSGFVRSMIRKKYAKIKEAKNALP